MTALVFEIEQPTPVQRGQLAPGRAGSRQTLEIMQRLVEQGAKDVNVREAAIAIVQRAGIAAHDFAGEARALFEFVRDRIRFTRDTVGVETLQGAPYTLTRGAGDCDDKATLLASLLRSIGHPARLVFRAVGANPATPGQLSHVYLVAQINGRMVPMDPTYGGTPFGWQLPRVNALMEQAL